MTDNDQHNEFVKGLIEDGVASEEDYRVEDVTERPVFYPSVEDLPLPGANPGAFFEQVHDVQATTEAANQEYDKPARTIKHRTVMNLAISDYEDLVCFEQTGLELGQRAESVYITRDMFNELGCPLIVTVSVRPGDHLN